MTAQQIEKVQHHAPFKPYRIFLSDQRNFLIEHPEFLWIVPGGRNIAIADSNGAIEVVDLLHVTGIRIAEQAGKKTR